MKGVENISLRAVVDGCVLPVKVVPGASRDKVAGVLGDALKVATSAAPEKGKANAAVGRIIAKVLGLDARSVTLVAGTTSPHKEFLVPGLSPEAVRQRLAEE
jgi:uncharacterized protein (TIGR00251 family)